MVSQHSWLNELLMLFVGFSLDAVKLLSKKIKPFPELKCFIHTVGLLENKDIDNSKQPDDA